MKRFYYFLIAIIIFTFCYEVQAATVEEKRKAVSEVAEAFLRKDKGRIQYESLRRNIFYSPEDVTTQSIQYSSCAVYTTSVYYQAFNMINPYFARWFTDAGIRVASGGNWTNDEVAETVSYGQCNDTVDETSENGIKSSCSNILKNSAGSIHDRGGYRDWYEAWYNLLEIGDVVGLVYNDNTAHTMIVTRKADQYVDSSSLSFTEAAGGTSNTYDLTNHSYSPTENSTIQLLALNGFYNRYKNIFDANNNPKYIKRYSIVRFITNNDRLTLTQSAQSRLKYPNMDIDKISTVNNQYNNRYYVSPGENVTYTIKITNNSLSDYNNLNIVEKIDDNVEVISNSNGQISGKNLSWKINVQAGKTANISYTVKVKSNITKETIESKGSVDQIPSRTIVMKVGKSLNKTEQNTLNTNYNNLDKKGKNDFKILNELYKKSFSIEVFSKESFDLSENIKVGKCYNIQNYLGSDDVITDYCDINLENDSIRKMTIGNYYSVQATNIKSVPNTIYSAWIFEEAAFRSNKSTVTEVKLSDLQIGDILVVDNDDDHDPATKNAEAYIYLNNKFIKANGSKEYSSDNLKAFLESLIGKSYVIIRPAQLLSRGNEGVEVVSVGNTFKEQSLIVIIVAAFLIITGVLINYKSIVSVKNNLK